MMRFLDPYAECIHDTLRIVAGYAFMLHGVQKLFGVLGGQQVEIVSLLGLAALIETVGGALIALGLFTRPAAFIASGEMAAAYFIAHAPRDGLFLFPSPTRESRRCSTASCSSISRRPAPARGVSTRV